MVYVSCVLHGDVLEITELYACLHTRSVLKSYCLDQEGKNLEP